MKDSIPIFDPYPQIEALGSELSEAIHRVLASGRFILGEEVEAFEAEVAEYIGVKFAVAVNSGTDALVIALRSNGVGPGDEVITTPFTFFATAEAIVAVGATPVFVDIDPKTYNLDPTLLGSVLTPQTAAILPVHLFGLACDMKSILDFAAKNNLVVIEDVAQAFGGTYEGKRLGSLGHAGAFSFFPSKNLGGCGDGGMITTNESDVATLARTLRAHGATEKYYHVAFGYNSRLDELQAAILRLKLQRVEEWNNQRRVIAQRYNELLRESSYMLPTEPSNAGHVFHQYTIGVPSGREVLQGKLRATGINAAVYYPHPLHKLPVFDAYELTQAEYASQSVLSLPIWPGMDPFILERVTDVLLA